MDTGVTEKKGNRANDSLNLKSNDKTEAKIYYSVVIISNI